MGVFHNFFKYTDQLDQVPPHPTIPYSNFDAYTQTDLTRTTVSYDATRRFIGSALTFGGVFEREDTQDSVGGGFGSGVTPQRRDHRSVFSELNGSVGAVSFLAGGRFEWYEGLGWSAVPRASVRLQVVPDHFALRAAVGRGFKAPNIQQQFIANAFIVPNPDLRPETSWSGEVGGQYTASNGLQLSATYFRQRFYDLIRVVPATAPETRLISKNIGRTDANGVELEASGTLPHGIVATGNVSWIHTSIVDNSGLAPAQFPVDSALPGRPVWVGGGTLDVPYRRLHGIVRATVVGRNIVLSEIFSGTRRTLDPYTLVNFGADYKINDRWQVYGRVENIFDTEYQEVFSFLSPGRGVYAGLRATLQ